MKLYIGNLPHAVTDEELRHVFMPYGTVESATVVMDRFTEKSRGFGFVKMAQSAEAQAAIQGLNGQDFQGRTLTVNEARPRENRNDEHGEQGNHRSW